MKTEFSRQIFETYSNFTKIRPVGAEMFHGDGRAGERQTDRQTKTRLAVAFLDFVKAANMAELNNHARLRTVKPPLFPAVLRW